MTLQEAEPPLVLASGSRARAGVLRAAGLAFDVMPVPVDEVAARQAAQAEGASAGDAALMLAGLKAASAARRRPEALVIGCDQILHGGTWFDKPADLAAARAQLLALRGAPHTLETAIVCHRHGGEIWRHLARPRLVMRAFSEAFLDTYLAAEGDPVLAGVGAYRLEGRGALLFERIEGEHAAILGLPLLALLGFLRQHRVLIS